jgi:serine phosphatase RsbU (regulator of sigma subunit)
LLNLKSLKIYGLELETGLKFQVFGGLTILLFIFRLAVYSPGSVFLVIINELLVGLTFAILFSYLSELVKSRAVNPFAFVMNIGILNAIIFFLLTFSDWILSSLITKTAGMAINQDLVSNFISFIYSYIILVCLAVLFLAFRELYFYRQKKNLRTYYNTMIVFFALTCASNLLNKVIEPNYIKETFLIISILLIVINSIKISWIAFIVKKEKIALLVLSIIISILFFTNLINGSADNIHNQVVVQFSPMLNSFLKIIMIYGAVYFSVLFFTTLFHIPTAEAYDRKSQEISFLQYFSKLITESHDFSELAETVTDITTKVCNAQAAWIAWYEGDEFKSIANKNIGYYDSNSITKFIFDNRPERDLNGSFIVNLKKYKNRPILSEGYLHFAAAPIRTHNEIKGFIIAAKKNDLMFDDEDRDAMDTFSDYASVAIENSRLLEESIEKERMEKELDVAREIQRKILPDRNPDLENLKISSVFIPAFEVGGDYYDFFEIDENKLGFIIADVSGKGISAAFIMAELKGIFESLSKTIERPKDILIKANEILERTLDRKNFVSAAYGLIDLKKETVSISRAGHCPIILVRNNIVENLKPTGMGLGLNFGSQFVDSLEEIELNLEGNDTIVLYTDGITEAKNKAMEDFGSIQFERILIDNNAENADEISNRVIKEVTLFSQSIPQHDDITLVILKWKQKLKNDGDTEWQNSAPQLKTQVT